MRSCFALLLAFPALAAPSKRSTRAANIMLLFPDQWRYEWHSLEVPGRVPGAKADVRTPTLAAHAARGTLFERAYVATPLCAPSRASLALGREYDEQHVPSNSFDVPTDFTTVYRALRDEGGYHVMVSGKDDMTKHSGYGADGSYRAVELGFSAWLGRTPGKDGTFNAQSSPYPAWLNNRTVPLTNGTTINALVAHRACNSATSYANMNRSWLTCCEGHEEGICDKPSPLPDDMYEDNWVTNHGLEMLRQKPDGKPWLLQVNWPGPHGPFVVTESMMRSVAGRTMPLPHDYWREGVDNASQLALSRRVYTAEVENLDAAMGKFIDAVRAMGEAEYNNTLICISSDHGELLGDHGDWSKEKPWEGSAHVPLVCAGPGVARGARVALPTTTMDLTATFLDYGGLLAPGRPASDVLANATSRTLRPLLEGGDRASSTARTFISSGLGRNASGAGASQYNWRMVVQRDALLNRTLKYVCCEGPCPGAPSNVLCKACSQAQWQDLLYDVDADPAEMTNLRNAMPDVAVALRQLLPPYFAERCKDASPAPTPTPAPISAAFQLRCPLRRCVGVNSADAHSIVSLVPCSSSVSTATSMLTRWVTDAGASGHLHLAANFSLEMALRNDGVPQCNRSSTINLRPVSGEHFALIWDSSNLLVRAPQSTCFAENRCLITVGSESLGLGDCNSSNARGFSAVPVPV